MILRTPTDNETFIPEACSLRLVMPAQAGIQGAGGGLDTGLRRYDGTESRYRCA